MVVCEYWCFHPYCEELTNTKYVVFTSVMSSFYRPQRSCGQGNIFTLVCHSVHRGGVLPQCMLGYHPPDQTTPPRPDPPPPREADSSIRSTSGRYASYWNTFLLLFYFRRKPGCDPSLPPAGPDLAQEAGAVRSLQLVLKQRQSLVPHRQESPHLVVGQRRPHPKHLLRRPPPLHLQDSLPVLLPWNWKRKRKK